MPISSSPLAPAINFFFGVFRMLYVYFVWIVFGCVLPLPAPCKDDAQPDGEGVLYSINVGAGIPKPQVPRAFVTRYGLVGDQQKTGFAKPWGGHGGADKAVMLWSLDVIQQVAAEGHPMCQPGRCGENLTIAGLDWRLVKTGARVQIGDTVLLEITFLKLPCGNQEQNFTDAGDGMQRISPVGYPDSSRLLARVLRSGYVAAGDKVRLYRSPRATSGTIVRSKVYTSAFVSLEYNS